MSDSAPLLAVEEVHAGYGRIPILHGISFGVRTRQVAGPTLLADPDVKRLYLGG